jgi:hypothetical protein
MTDETYLRFTRRQKAGFAAICCGKRFANPHHGCLTYVIWTSVPKRAENSSPVPFDLLAVL